MNQQTIIQNKADYKFYLLLEGLHREETGMNFNEDTYMPFTLIYSDYVAYTNQFDYIESYFNTDSKHEKDYFKKNIYPIITQNHEDMFKDISKTKNILTIGIVAFIFIGVQLMGILDAFFPTGDLIILGIYAAIIFLLFQSRKIMIRKAEDERLKKLLGVLDSNIKRLDEAMNTLLSAGVQFQYFNDDRIDNAFIKKHFSELFYTDPFRYVQNIYLTDPNKSLFEALQLYNNEMYKQAKERQAYNYEQEIQRQQEAEAINAEIAERDREFMMYLAAYEEEREQQRNNWE